MPLKPGYSRDVINANIVALINEGKPERMAVAIALDNGRKCFFKRYPKGFPPWHLRTAAEKARTGRVKTNPIPRADAMEAAADLSRRFMGREPDLELEFPKPNIPDAMACIGKVFAIEYIAERDGKTNTYRHVFEKQRARPHLAVSPDGRLVTMIGGSWHFGEDGFEDH